MRFPLTLKEALAACRESYVGYTTLESQMIARTQHCYAVARFASNLEIFSWPPETQIFGVLGSCCLLTGAVRFLYFPDHGPRPPS